MATRRTDKEILLDSLPTDGSSIGNVSLRYQLGWDEEKYWRVRDELTSDGEIGLGKGKGGSVYRIRALKAEKEKKTTEKETAYKNEKSLYAPFLSNIEVKYTKDLQINDFVAEDTSSQGARTTGGIWTRPDITLITVEKYTFIPDKTMNVITFELKHSAAFTVTGVFETASHTRFANKSYYVGYLPNGWNEDDQSLSRILAECERFEIGLMYFKDPADYSSYEIVLESARSQPDPAEQNQFIEQQLNEQNKKKLLSILK